MTRLSFGAAILAYKQEDYISYCLRALSAHLDHIIVLFSHDPWIRYNPRARQEFTEPDRTGQILESLKQELPNVSIIEGVWDDEESMRNCGLNALRKKDIQVCLIVDADEFYPEDGLENLKAEITRYNSPGTCYEARFRTCFKRFDYRITYDHRAPVAVHLDSSTAFIKHRLASGTNQHLPDEIYFWHMGYVLSDERMKEKLGTFGHAHEIVQDWFEEKWLNWSPQTLNLFRKNPTSRWPRAVQMDARVLPQILHSHPFFPNGNGNKIKRIID